ncbi:MAG: hypothetical protein KUG52_03160 [Immundisolibacteraceae bacterium]|nr:hypothetical protein [Immundisolibacteraceae bacterium]
MNGLSYQLVRILNGAWRRRYAVLTPILILPIMGLLVGTLTPQHYRSHTSMLIQETAKMNPFLQDLAVSSMVDERMEALKTLLRSRHILGAVAEQRGLIAADAPARDYDLAIDQLADAVAVEMVGKDLIRIDYEAAEPEGMEQTLNLISDYFIEQLLAPERSSMRDSSTFLSEHLLQRRDQLETAETALARFKDEHASELPELLPANLERLSRLRQLIAERKSEYAGAVKSLGSLDQQLSKTNPVVARLEKQIVQLRGGLALLQARYTDHHSEVLGALRELGRLELERQKVMASDSQRMSSDQLWKIATVTTTDNNAQRQPLLISQLENLQLARNRVETLQAQIESLDVMVTKLEQQTTRFGDHERELGQLERDLRINRELYEDLLHRREMAQVTGSLSVFEQEKRVKVIDRPFTPTAPANPPLALFIASGLVGGLLLGVGLAMLLEFTDASLRHRQEIEAITGVPLLCRIPPLNAHG